MNQFFDLTGKVAIVTGSSMGLGKAIAMAYGDYGADVILCARSTDLLEEVALKIREKGREALVVKTDVTKKKDVDAMVAAAMGKFGKIDILVNNSGISINNSIVHLSENDFDRVMDVNVKGYFLCAQAVGKIMTKQKSGKIINMASIFGNVSLPQTSLYTISKAAIIGLTKACAIEWAGLNIQVNALSPGFIDSGMGVKSKEEYGSFIEKFMPAGRYGREEEIVGAAIYLASPVSDYTTGSVMLVDGGWSAQ
ncbi:SDR family NAD(P)-dependent oxidoreductase [Thermodesulfobacteriota bacterium]